MKKTPITACLRQICCTKTLKIMRNTLLLLLINVTLEYDVYGLEEVVAVGYGTQKRKTLTGAVGTVRSEQLTIRPAANTSELLFAYRTVEKS